MLRKSRLPASLLTVSLAGLAGCGGGGSGGSGLAVAPFPLPAPNPPTSPAPPPSPGAVVGPAGGWADTSSSRSFTDFDVMAEHKPRDDKSVASTLSQDQLLIRYDTTVKSYVIDVPQGTQWVETFSTKFGTANNNGFAIPTEVRVASNTASHANILEYYSIFDGTLSHGFSVFGPATAASAIPGTGLATYSGTMAAVTDSAFIRPSEGFVTDITAGGTVSLNLDFATGTFEGLMKGEVFCGNCFEAAFPQLKFGGELSSSNRSLLSGSFVTDLQGVNSINGQFAGPNAEEIMARFTVPTIDGNSGEQIQLMGVWRLGK